MSEESLEIRYERDDLRMRVKELEWQVERLTDALKGYRENHAQLLDCAGIDRCGLCVSADAALTRPAAKEEK